MYLFYCARSKLQHLGSLIFTVACGILCCGLRDLVPQPRIKPRPPALGAESLSHWTIKEGPSWIIQTLPRVRLGDYLTSLRLLSFPLRQ